MFPYIISKQYLMLVRFILTISIIGFWSALIDYHWIFLSHLLNVTAYQSRRKDAVIPYY